MTDNAVIARRSFLAGALVLLGLRGPALAQEPAESASKVSAQEAPGTWRHALTLLGEPKYGPDFQHFDYADPKAPVGGLVRLGAQGGFDNLNMIVNGLKGDLEGGITQIYDTLMEDSGDEPFSSYGLLAEGVRIAEDGRSVTYRLRKDTRWHDGKPVTVEDVIWSFDTLKANSPFYAAYYHTVVKAEPGAEREVVFRFGEAGNPTELIHALIDLGTKDLTVVNNNAGNGHIGLAALLEAGRVAKIICSFPRSSRSEVFQELYRTGKIELEVVPQGTLAERLRAGGAR